MQRTLRGTITEFIMSPPGIEPTVRIAICESSALTIRAINATRTLCGTITDAMLLPGWPQAICTTSHTHVSNGGLGLYQDHCHGEYVTVTVTVTMCLSIRWAHEKSVSGFPRPP
jgi:hypothetical protein